MIQANRRQLVDLLYNLKRQFPETIDLYQQAVSYSPTTGLNVPTYNKLTILRAVLLPGLAAQAFKYTSSFLGANRQFSYEGTYGIEDREVLIDGKDVPSQYTLNKDNWFVVWQRKRYKIITLVDLDFNVGYYLHIQKTDVGQWFDIHDASLTDTLIPNETYNGSL